MPAHPWAVAPPPSSPPLAPAAAASAGGRSNDASSAAAVSAAYVAGASRWRYHTRATSRGGSGRGPANRAVRSAAWPWGR